MRAPALPDQSEWENHWDGVLQTGATLAIGRKSSAFGGNWFAVGPATNFRKGETFSYDEEGWTAAWVRFATGDPDAAQAFLDRSGSTIDPDGLQQRREELRIIEGSAFVDADFSLLTGYNLGSFQLGDSVRLIFAPDRLVIAEPRSAHILSEIRYPQLEAVKVLGAGLVVTGGGFIGGGQGVMGSLEGMAIATALNHFTTKATVENLVEIRGTDFQQVWLNTDLAPPALKLSMMPVQAQVGRATVRPTIATQLAQLHELHLAGALSADEFELAKSRVLSEVNV